MKECGRCGSLVNDEHKTCPSCGSNYVLNIDTQQTSTPAPAPAPAIKKIKKKTIREQFNTTGSPVQMLTISLLFAIFAISYHFTKPPEKPETRHDSCAPQNLNCLAKVAKVDAEFACKSAIESAALHGVRWSNSFLDSVFTRFWWKDKNLGVVSYYGNQAEFQNGLGLYVKTSYVCEFNIYSKSVENVRVN